MTGQPEIECPFCGATLDSAEIYCPECGTDLVENNKYNY